MLAPQHHHEESAGEASDDFVEGSSASEHDGNDSDGRESREQKRAEGAKQRRKRKQSRLDAIMSIEDVTAKDHEKAPATASDFERLLVGSPSSSYVWINYMAFQ